MVTRTQNGNGLPGLFRTLHDGEPAEAVSGQLQVLSLDQIRVVPGSNEYTEGPGRRTPEPARHKSELELSGTGDEERQCLVQERPQFRRPAPDPQVSLEPCPQTRNAGLWDDTGNSSPGASSAQRLLEGPEVDRTARGHPEPPELKGDTGKEPTGKGSVEHGERCAACGGCRCEACTRVRRLPSCWVCGRRCLCSPDSVVEYGTCVCCIKGLFYHCSSDDEDVCADNPFSCSPSRRCVRWSVIGALSLLLPCLLCYLPLRGCLTLCQACYNCARSPGCRCKARGDAHLQSTRKQT